MSATIGTTFSTGVLARNPAWIQLLGLCPLLAVSSSLVNALALSFASAFVLVGANTAIALLRRSIPGFVRLPCFVLIIATFTTCTVLLMQAYAFDLYLRVALFVQIIVTNCMILGRAEAFASHQPVGRALVDALGTAAGFTLALLALGAARELIGRGTLLADMDMLLGPAAAGWTLSMGDGYPGLLLASLPPGAFIIAGLLLGTGRAIATRSRRAPKEVNAQ